MKKNVRVVIAIQGGAGGEGGPHSTFWKVLFRTPGEVGGSLERKEKR